MKLPERLDIRLAMLPAPDGRNANFVLVAPSPLKADLALFSRKSGMSAVLTHDAGVSWPDRTGCQLAETLLGQGHPAALSFASLADAITCHRRLVREAAQ